MTAVAMHLDDPVLEQELRDIAHQLIELNASERDAREKWRGATTLDASATLGHIAESKRALRERQREIQDAASAGSQRQQAQTRALMLLSERYADLDEKVDRLEKKIDLLSDRMMQLLAGLGVAVVAVQALALVLQ
jgi:chromosome segregation ATPase